MKNSNKKKGTGAVLFLMFLCSVVTSVAQSQQLCESVWTWYGINGPPPKWATCTDEGPLAGWGIYSCKQRLASCPSHKAQNTCSDAACGVPINLATGNVDITQNDVSIPGLGRGLVLVRTWNSMWPINELGSQSGMFGRNWRVNYEERVYTSNGEINYSRGDGSFWLFGMQAGTGALIVSAPANETATITTGDPYCGWLGCVDTTWRIKFRNGDQKVFDINSGSLKAIIDRNGNTTNLAYDSQNRLITVTDPGSRTLTFNYLDANSRLVSSVVAAAGTFTYEYVDGGHLSKVTRPDGSFVTFEYDDHALITAVKDSQGKILESHTYDELCRGVTSSRANGVEALTVSYSQQPIIRSSGEGGSGGSGGGVVKERSTSCP